MLFYVDQFSRDAQSAGIYISLGFSYFSQSSSAHRVIVCKDLRKLTEPLINSKTHCLCLVLVWLRFFTLCGTGLGPEVVTSSPAFHHFRFQPGDQNFIDFDSFCWHSQGKLTSLTQLSISSILGYIFEVLATRSVRNRQPLLMVQCNLGFSTHFCLLVRQTSEYSLPRMSDLFHLEVFSAAARCFLWTANMRSRLGEVLYSTAEELVLVTSSITRATSRAFFVHSSYSSLCQ